MEGLHQQMEMMKMLQQQLPIGVIPLPVKLESTCSQTL
jgi:hypothetical protein